MLYVLWMLTAVVAVTLVLATVALTDRARSHRILNSTVYLNSSNPSVGLHAAPTLSSPVVAALVRGSPVTVLAVAEAAGQTWYQVQKGEMKPGWVSADTIRLSPP